MRHNRIVRFATLAVAALSLQLLLAGSALPCATLDQASPGNGSQTSMPDMPMDGEHTGDASHEDCDGPPTPLTCPFAVMCATAALPVIDHVSAASLTVQSQQAAIVPALRSAPETVDLPPPRA